MCGRYYFHYQPQDEPYFTLVQQLEIALHADGEVFPSDPVLTLRKEAQGIHAVLGTWGFSLAKRRVINARLETIQEKALFRPFLRNRCALPCDGYYEWQRDETGKKHKQRIFQSQKPRLYLAAIYNDRQEVCVLTIPARGRLAHIHDRMPVVLAENGMKAYLNAQQGVRIINAALHVQAVE